MTNTEENVYSGGLAISPKLGKIVGQGQETRLGPINMRVLMLLIEAHGQVVARSQIFDSVWPNQSISDDTLTRCISDLRALLSPLCDGLKLIETVPKRGYRWLPSVASKQPASDPLQRHTALHSKSPWMVSLAGIFGLMVLFGAASLWLVGWVGAPSQVTLAVLPLTAMKADQEALVADMDELLRAQLQTVDGVRILSAKAIAAGIQTPYPYFANEFGAQWVIEGRVRQGHNNMRVSFSLVEAKTALVLFSRVEIVTGKDTDLAGISAAFVKDVETLLTQSK